MPNPTFVLIMMRFTNFLNVTKARLLLNKMYIARKRFLDQGTLFMHFDTIISSNHSCNIPKSIASKLPSTWIRVQEPQDMENLDSSVLNRSSIIIHKKSIVMSLHFICKFPSWIKTCDMFSWLSSSISKWEIINDHMFMDPQRNATSKKMSSQTNKPYKYKP